MDFVLILGARSDIANAIAHEYAKLGYGLYLAARNSAGLQPAAEDLRIRYSTEVRTVEFDVRDFASHSDFFADLDPMPAGVICVVGYMGDHESAKSDFSETACVIESNYTGCVSILNIAANALEKHNKGFIVGISSVAGDRGRQSNYYYGSAKAGFTAYLAGLRNRLTAAAVQVLTVKPGFVATKMTENLDLPAPLTAQPQEVARDITRAQQKGRDILYTKWFWRYIMFIIRLVPERIFKKLKL